MQQPDSSKRVTREDIEAAVPLWIIPTDTLLPEQESRRTIGTAIFDALPATQAASETVDAAWGALLPYADHRFDCIRAADLSGINGDEWGGDRARPCSCGLDDVLAALSRSTPTPDATDALFDPFVAAAATEMRARLDHGAQKFGRSWRSHYSNAANLTNLRRAVDHLQAARRNSDDPAEWAKRAADVANQAFMFADPKRHP